MSSRPQLENCYGPRNGKRLKTSGQAALQRGRLSRRCRLNPAKGNKCWLAEEGQGELCRSAFLRRTGIWTQPIFSRLPKQPFLSLPLISAAYHCTMQCSSNTAPSPASCPPFYNLFPPSFCSSTLFLHFFLFIFFLPAAWVLSLTFKNGTWL